MIARVPLWRIAQTVHQAKVICLSASDDADFVTGVTIDVTGEQSAGDVQHRIIF